MKKRRKLPIQGLILVTIGAWFLLKYLGIVQLPLGRIILILIGVVILFKGIEMLSGRRNDRDHDHDDQSQAWQAYRPQEGQGTPPPPPLHEDPIMKYKTGNFEQTWTNEKSEPKPNPNSSSGGQFNHSYQQHYEGNKGHYSNEVINRSSFIGDFKFGKEYWELRPMNLSHFIGDTTIDLTKAYIPVGETKITVNAFIGDIKVFIPNDSSVGVRLEMHAFIGESKMVDQREGGFISNVFTETDGYREADKKLHIVFSSFIGDLKVKRVG